MGRFAKSLDLRLGAYHETYDLEVRFAVGGGDVLYTPGFAALHPGLPLFKPFRLFGLANHRSVCIMWVWVDSLIS